MDQAGRKQMKNRIRYMKDTIKQAKQDWEVQDDADLLHTLRKLSANLRLAISYLEGHECCKCETDELFRSFHEDVYRESTSKPSSGGGVERTVACLCLRCGRRWEEDDS